LWDAVIQQKDLIVAATLEELRLNAKAEAWARSKVPHWRGGWIRGFDQCFDPERFLLPAEEILALDPLFHWVLHTTREAFHDANLGLNPGHQSKLFLANLGYPSRTYVHFAETIWLKDFAEALIAGNPPRADNRFSSGYPAFLQPRHWALGKPWL